MDQGRLPSTNGTSVRLWTCLAITAIVISFACQDTAEPSATAMPGEGVCLPNGSSEVVEVRDGPFRFNVGLYTDKRLRNRAEATSPSTTSDIPGVGWRADWIYGGDEAGPVREGAGAIESIAGELASLTPALTDGTHGGHPLGGIVLPDEAKPGDRFGLGVRLQIEDDNYAAGVFFTLEGNSKDGFAACDVSIARGWPLKDPRQTSAQSLGRSASILQS